MLDNFIKIVERENLFNFNRSNYLRLDANERVAPFNKKDLINLKKLISNYNIQAYPTKRNQVVDKISKKYNIKKKNLSLMPGADSVLKYLFEIISKKKGNVLTIYPTYGMIDVYSKIYKKKLVKINDENSILFKKKSIYRNITMVYLAYPNMPSGKLIENDFLNFVLNFTNKKKIPLIIDEAYIDYSSKISNCSKINKYKNLVVIKTFSKFYGLAGLRLSFIASHYKNILAFDTIRPPHDVSLLNLEILNYFLSKKKDNYLNNIKKSRKIIERWCKFLNLKYQMTEANFFHIFFQKKNISKIVKYLFKKKILVKSSKTINRGAPYLGPADTIRVTIGNSKQMNNFFNKLKICRYIK